MFGSTILKFQHWLIALTIVSPALLLIIANNTTQELADGISGLLLYTSTLLSTLLIFSYKEKKRYLICTFAVIIFMALYQRYIVTPRDSGVFTSFFVHGVGGCLSGYAINNYRLFIKYASYFSFVLCVLLIIEPITHALMGLENMSTGYAIVPLVILLFLKYFLSRKKIYLIIAIPLSFEVLLFSSRGCGLSIILAVVLFKLWDNHSRGIKTKKSIIWLIAISLLGVIAFMGSVNYLIKIHYFATEDSSFVGRVIYGGAEESSGRDLIILSALDLIKENYLLGMGMGNDRPHLSFYTGYAYAHNILLEVILNYGLIIGLAFIFGFVKICYSSIRKNKMSFAPYILFALLSMYMVRLLFSGSYLESSYEVFFIVGVAVRTLEKYPQQSYMRKSLNH